MHQIIRNHFTQQPVSMRLPDLSQYATLVRLRHLHVPTQLALALQALTKLRRCGEHRAQLLVTSEDGFAWPRSPMSAHCSFHRPGELRHALRQRGITPIGAAYDDPQGSFTLHALASGVSPTALNLAPLPTRERIVLDVEGGAVLAIRHAPAVQVCTH